MKEYHKINSIFKRDEKTKQFLMWAWATPEFEYLADKEWTWDEKIDGTNIRVHWDASALRTFGGRTDNASIPAHLFARLEELFPVEKLRDVLGVDANMTLYGEGFGAKIQKGGAYIPDGCDFILFDVRIGNWWLKREDVEEIAGRLGIRVTPMLGEGTIAEAIEYVRGGFKSKIGTADAEGLILRPKVPLFTRSGERIITKIKTRDFTNA